MTELYTDGNELGGLLADFLAADPTTLRRRCQSCHNEHPLASHRAYHGAGVVLRCPACGDVALVIGECEGELDGAGVATYGARADAADEHSLRAGLDAIVDRLGVPDALVYNAALIQGDAVGDLSVAQHLDAWAVNVVGAITAAAHLLPRMADAGGGTYVITGGMPVPVPDVTSLSLGKAGVRALAELLDTQFGPAGIHVATVTVAGTVAPGTAFDPDEIAEHYWRLHTQPAGAWEREFLYEGTAALSS
jgi:NAD(P)-dependent dehydrogenase (short-subunit alcohol dehydrogenase family)